MRETPFALPLAGVPFRRWAASGAGPVDPVSRPGLRSHHVMDDLLDQRDDSAAGGRRRPRDVGRADHAA